MNECLKTFLSHCRPLALPEAWRLCPADEAAFTGPHEPAAAWATLLEYHSAAELLAAGLAEETDEGISLHHLLHAPDLDFLLLQESSSGKRWNLVTDSGCLRGDRAPLLEALLDERTVESLGTEQTVYLTCSIVDAVLLRSFGLAAAPVADAVPLKQADVELLETYYGVTRQQTIWESAAAEEEAAKAANAPPPQTMEEVSALLPPYLLPEFDGYCGPHRHAQLRLTLVGWDVANLDRKEPASVGALREEFLKLRRFRRLRTEVVAFWRPTEEDVEQIRFAQTRDEVSWLQSALVDNIDDCLTWVDGTVRMPTRPDDLTEAFDGLAGVRSDLADSANRERIAVANQKFEAILHRRLRAPLLRRAEQATDPLERSLCVQLAQLQELFHKQATAACRDVLMKTARTDVQDGETVDVKSLLALSNQLLMLAKELRICKPLATQRTARPTTAASIFPRFGNSDWAGSN